MRAFYSRFSALPMALLGALGAQAASAQTPLLPQSMLRQPPTQSVSMAASYCKQSTLTGTIFMDRLTTIIRHGDLTDVAFTEKVLDTKFGLDVESTTNGIKASSSLIYRTNQILGSPIRVDLDVTIFKPQQIAYDTIGVLGIGSVGPPFQPENFIVRCLRISNSDVIARFGNSFSYNPLLPDMLTTHPAVPLSPMTRNSQEVWAYQQASAPGKGGAKFFLGFTYDSENHLIYTFRIIERP